MARVFVGVGSNLGDRRRYLEAAQNAVSTLKGVRMVRQSSLYETKPVGGPPQGEYLNGVWELETGLLPRQLLNEFLAIEEKLGRQRTGRNAPRTIDLDILFYDGLVLDLPGLKIPHPRLEERFFVLRPMTDLEPEWNHPQLKKTVRTLLESLLERNPNP